MCRWYRNVLPAKSAHPWPLSQQTHFFAARNVARLGTVGKTMANASAQRPTRRVPIENTEERYGAAAVGLHWMMAVLLVSLLALGLYMVGLPDAGFDTLKIRLIVYHKSL